MCGEVRLECGRFGINLLKRLLSLADVGKTAALTAWDFAGHDDRTLANMSCARIFD
jgi:hypothetical protein